jgi:large subunit ribosomal protein L21
LLSAFFPDLPLDFRPVAFYETGRFVVAFRRDILRFSEFSDFRPEAGPRRTLPFAATKLGSSLLVQLQRSRSRESAEPDRTRGRTMFAVIKTGGKQYRVAADEQIAVMSLAGEAGETVTFSDVLLVEKDGATQFGAPFVAGATVKGEIVEQTRGPKVISFKKRRRKNSKRKRGHRQDLTLVRITEVVA